MGKRVSLAFLAALTAGCGAGINKKGDGTYAMLDLDVPLLPVSLPVFPTDLTLDGFAKSVKAELDDFAPGASSLLGSQVDAGVTALEKRLEDASLTILQPGVLSGAAGDRVQELLNQLVTFERVGLVLEVENKTSDLAAAPAVFELYMDEAEAAETFAEDTRITWDASSAEGLNLTSDGNAVILKPGQSAVLSVPDLPRLREFLTTPNGARFGIGYKSVYRMADTQNGADVEAEVSVFGRCVAAVAAKEVPFGDALGFSVSKDCPKPQDLLKWHLSFKSARLGITIQKKLIDLPEIPACAEFARQHDLPLLGEACGPAQAEAWREAKINL